MIELSAADVEALRQDHTRRLGVEPTPAEDAALVERYVDDEVLYREALAMGLDRGDIIVRRRLLQKMEFLLEGLHPVPEPTDAELEAYLEAHADRYRTPARIDLVHVFVSRDRHGDGAGAVAAALREQLLAGANFAALGDPFLRGRELRAQSEQDLAGIFGPAFARAVVELPVDTWSPPIASSYGLHLVRVRARNPAALPPLARIRATVQQDWVDERRRATLRAAVDELRQKYVVRVERAADGSP
ncbi:MAG TPA: peptidylprolyl isomerase [Candidatus Limnocylindria bacterium]|nr:peptidylprolyl isomerase [Candidatus Limnocylindria bacterium]